MGKIHGPEDSIPFLAIHPGEHLMDELEYRGIEVDQFADVIKCDHEDFRKIIDGKAPITTEVAMKIEAAIGAKAYVWLGLQEDYDIQMAHKDKKLARVLKQIQSAAASVLL